MLGRRTRLGRVAARGWVTAWTAALVLVLSGCQALPGGGGRDVSENFKGAAAQELANAVASGQRSAIRELVEGGTSADTTGTDGVTMLQLAIYENKHGAFLTLLDLGADPDQVGYRGDAALHTAANASTHHYLEALLEAGADPDVRNATTQRTPLMEAASMFTEDQFWLLLDAGADVTLADRSGTTALHRAALTNAISHVLPLLERGADPVATDDVGATFQDYLYHGDPDILHARARRELGKVADWLTAHDIPLHDKVPWPGS